MMATRKNMRKLLLGTALLALALPALGLNFSKTAAKVTQPKNFAAADINYFEEMAERFNNAEVPAPADFKKLVKGQLALKAQPLALRASKLTTSFDGRDYLVRVDKPTQGDEYKTFDIVSTLDAAVAGSGRVQIRKDGKILIARILSGNNVIGYAMYGSPKAQAAAMPGAGTSAIPSAETINPTQGDAQVATPKPSANTPAATPTAAHPTAQTQTSAAAVAAAPATDQSILHVTPPPPPASAQADTVARKKHTPLSARATELLVTASKKAIAVTERVKTAVSTFYKTHPVASKITVGAAAAVIAAGTVFAIVHFGLPGIFWALMLKQLNTLSKSLPGKVVKAMASPITKKWKNFMKTVTGEIKKPDTPAPPKPPDKP